MKNIIIRGELHFEIIGNDTVQCYLGNPNDPESEFIFEVHKSYIKDMIAGLTALNLIKKYAEMSLKDLDFS